VELASKPFSSTRNLQTSSRPVTEDPSTARWSRFRPLKPLKRRKSTVLAISAESNGEYRGQRRGSDSTADEEKESEGGRERWVCVLPLSRGRLPATTAALTTASIGSVIRM
jgi:hypothetical protein